MNWIASRIQFSSARTIFPNISSKFKKIQETEEKVKSNDINLAENFQFLSVIQWFPPDNGNSTLLSSSQIFWKLINKEVRTKRCKKEKGRVGEIEGNRWVNILHFASCCIPAGMLFRRVISPLSLSLVVIGFFGGLSNFFLVHSSRNGNSRPYVV